MSDGYDQGCPIAVALDVIGDRWTMLLLRDLAHAPLRFGDLQVINPKLSPNLLTKRLRQLEQAGLLRRRLLPPPAASTVYELDPATREALLPVLNALGRFGAHLFEGAPVGPTSELLAQMGRNARWVLAKGVDFTATFRMKLGPHDFGLLVSPSRIDTTPEPPAEPDATIAAAPPTLVRLFNAGISIDDAESCGALHISGDRRRARQLLGLLALGPIRDAAPPQ